MEKLNDQELLEAFYRAKELDCSPDFIQLLLEEMAKRNIEIEGHSYSARLV